MLIFLTQVRTRKRILVNMNRIVCAETFAGFTEILVGDGSKAIQVIETPEQIYNMTRDSGGSYIPKF